MLDALLQDLRYGLRLLARSPGFTAAAVLALGLGIGAVTAIDSVVDAVLLRPLPYPDAERIVMVWESNPARGWDQFAVAPANFVDWARDSRAFESLVALRQTPFVLTGQTEPERVQGLRATPGLAALAGLEPALGRGFLPEEFAGGKEHVALLSDALWKRRFGARAEVLGSAVTLSAESYTVVGVLPAGVRLPTDAEILTPLVFTPEELQHRGAHYLVAMARLKPGVAVETAAAEMRALASGLETRYPDTNTGWTVRLVPLYEAMVGGVRPALLALFGAVACVLLIACANVANLLLARAAARRGEIAVRAALGAGRGRLVRQLLTESVLLALLGGGLGTFLGWWAVDLIRALQPGSLPRIQSLAVNGRVLLFTAGVSMLSGVLFGILPGLLLSRARLGGGLQEAGRGVRGRLRHGTRRVLVAAQVALCLVLLIGAGLHIRSFARLMEIDPGFDPAGVLSMRISLPDRTYPDAPRQAAFFDRVVTEVRGLPGVSDAAVVSAIPVSDDDLIFSFTVEGRAPLPPTDEKSANWYAVSPGYFETLRIPLVRGRLFTDADGARAPRVALVNATMARRIWPDEDPIGRQIRMGIESGAVRTIVGIVGDVRHYGLDQDVTMQMYEPVAQRPVGSMSLVLRAGNDPRTLAPAARRAVLIADPEQPVSEVRTLDEILSRSTAQRRFSLLLLSVFAGVALLLAAVGIYGVVAYSVAQRTHEIGVRMALGAQRGAILGLLLRQGMATALAGVAFGLLGALALARLIRGLLFGVGGADPATFVAMSLVLSGVAFLATYIPARRATRVDPTTALRYE